jgi:hypothetical protein
MESGQKSTVFQQPVVYKDPYLPYDIFMAMGREECSLPNWGSLVLLHFLLFCPWNVGARHLLSYIVHFPLGFVINISYHFKRMT